MLPQITVPHYYVKLPSNKKEIQIRPFLVKEEKILLVASYSSDPTEMKNAIEQVISDCIITKGIEVAKLPTIDIEYLLIQLRLRSVGEKIEIDYLCDNQIDGQSCGEPFRIDINLNDIEQTGPVPEMNMKIDDKLGVMLRLPRYNFIENLDNSGSYSFDLFKEIVEAVYDDQQVYKTSDVTDEELLNFMNSLTKPQYQKIEDWLTRIPEFVVHKTHTCVKCGKTHEVTVNDLSSFF